MSVLAKIIHSLSIPAGLSWRGWMSEQVVIEYRLTEAVVTIAAWAPFPSVTRLISVVTSLQVVKSIQWSAPSAKQSLRFSSPPSWTITWVFSGRKIIERLAYSDDTTTHVLGILNRWKLWGTQLAMRDDSLPRWPRPPPAPGSTTQSPGFVSLYFNAR